MKRLMMICVVLFSLLSGVEVGAVVINFEGDSPGAKPNGWQSVDSSLVSFFDSMGENLDVYDYGWQSNGQALATNYDDPSYLIMKFSVSINSLSLDFGNDDPGWTNPGDEAILTAYLDDTFVGESRVEMNRDDIMNQTISISGVVFDKATFFYNTTAADGLIEIVDNIQFVPEPSTICLLGVGALRLLRKKRSA